MPSCAASDKRGVILLCLFSQTFLHARILFFMNAPSNPLSRRQFLKASTTALTAAALSPIAIAPSSAAVSPGKIIGIQAGAIFFLDEGTEKVLDIFQEKGAVNT